mmetsp:Transcript_7959/g.27842  ORF Transcript_7959/g.27842 Transcript_7959/m.27842 type:complete len:1349 (-) Transcript_7959:196-4242(-)
MAAFAGDIDVFTRSTGVHWGGKWVAARGTVVGAVFKTVGIDVKYDKTVLLNEDSRVRATREKDRPYCVSVHNFNGASRSNRTFDCKNEFGLATWQRLLAQAIASTKWGAGDALASVRSLTLLTRMADAHPASPTYEAEAVFQNDAKPPLIHALPPKSQAHLRWRRAFQHVAVQVLSRRRAERGYTNFELYKLQSQLRDVARKSRRNLLFKMKRIIMTCVFDKAKAERLLESLQMATLTAAKKQGLTIDLDAEFPAPASFRNAQSIDLRNAPKPTQTQQQRANSDGASLFRAGLTRMLARDRVLPTLVKTVQHFSSKEKVGVADAVRCMYIGNVMETLLQLPGGLAALLLEPRERFYFRKLCASTLLCRIPIVSKHILDMLAALAVLPDERLDGFSVVANILREVDDAASWEGKCCSPLPLMAAPGATVAGAPPPFGALAQFLIAAPEHGDALRSAALDLFACLVSHVQVHRGRGEALWMQAQLMHAIRCVVPLSKRDAEDCKHACPPAVALAAQLQRDSEGEGEQQAMLRISVDCFLDTWDSRLLDESDELQDLSDVLDADDSTVRILILGDRVKRAALLLADADVDAVVEAFGGDLDKASQNWAAHAHGVRLPQTTQAMHKLAVRSGAVPPPLVPRREAALDGAESLAVQAAAATAESKPSFESVKNDPVYSKFFKMLRMHVPRAAVAARMVGDGLDPSILEGGEAAPAPVVQLAVEAAIKDDAKYVKYFKMLRMHIPKAAVQMQMTQAGLDPQILDADPEAAADAVLAAFKPVEKKAEGPALRDDPKYSKYFKMLAMHVPKMAVAARMTGDGLDASILDVDPAEPAPLAGNLAPKAKVVVDAGPPRGCAVAPSGPVRKIFLDVLTDAEGTCWAQDGKKVYLDTAALAQLEADFVPPPRRNELSQADAAAARSVARADEESSQAKKSLRSLATEAIGGKKAFSLNLLKSSLKMDNEVLAQAISSLDLDGRTFQGNLPRLSTLYNMLASADDLEAILPLAMDVKVHENLDDVSKFFVALVRVPRPRLKVLALWLAETLVDRAADAASTLKALTEAANAAKASTALKRVLGAVCAVSNFLNHKTARANVAGVKVSSLLKLQQTRTTKATKHRDLLQYMTQFSGVDADVLRDELPAETLRLALTGLPPTELKMEVAKIRQERVSVVAEAEAIAKDGDLNASDRARKIAADAAVALLDLDAAVQAMDESIDACFSHFGEAPTTAADEFLRDLESFTAAYCAAAEHLAETRQRAVQRDHLAAKKLAREAERLKLQDAREAKAKLSAMQPAGGGWTASGAQERKRLPGVTDAQREVAPAATVDDWRARMMVRGGRAESRYGGDFEGDGFEWDD